MTRIVQIAPFIGPGTGVAGVAWNLERELRVLGATVERFTFDDARPGTPRSRPERAKTHGGAARAPRVFAQSRLGARIARGWGLVWFSTVGTTRARRFLAERPDAIAICHNSVMAGDVYVNHGVVLAAMRARGRPAWLMVRNPFHIFTYLRDRIRYRGRTHRAVVALSQSDAAELHSTYGRVRPPIVVIPNGVDLDRFHPPTPEERRQARELLNLGDEERVAVFLGHEFDRKGLSFVLEGLRYAGSVLLLVVGGSHDLIEAAKAEAAALGVAQRVLFIGPRPDPTRFLAASDMFVLPSAYEANALVVLEALASGLPVVATRVGFAPEIIVDGQNGFLIERDGRAVGERLALLEGEDLSEWGRRARASVEPYSWRAVARRYLDLAEDLLAERDRDAAGDRVARGRG